VSDYVNRLQQSLEKKLSHFEIMEDLLLKQKQMLDKNDYRGFDKLCDEVDSIVRLLKDLDYEIAILESTVDPDSERTEITLDGGLRKLIFEVRAKALENRQFLDSLAESLLDSKDKVKKELEETVALGKISGYKPIIADRPVYFDKRN